MARVPENLKHLALPDIHTQLSEVFKVIPMVGNYHEPVASLGHDQHQICLDISSDLDLMLTFTHDPVTISSIQRITSASSGAESLFWKLGYERLHISISPSTCRRRYPKICA